MIISTFLPSQLKFQITTASAPQKALFGSNHSFDAHLDWRQGPPKRERWLSSHLSWKKPACPLAPPPLLGDDDQLVSSKCTSAMHNDSTQLYQILQKYSQYCKFEKDLEVASFDWFASCSHSVPFLFQTLLIASNTQTFPSKIFFGMVHRFSVLCFFLYGNNRMLIWHHSIRHLLHFDVYLYWFMITIFVYRGWCWFGRAMIVRRFFWWRIWRWYSRLQQFILPLLITYIVVLTCAPATLLLVLDKWASAHPGFFMDPPTRKSNCPFGVPLSGYCV